MCSRENEVTKGAYLKEKFGNMARWVESEVGKENLPADVIAGIADRSELEVCALAGALQSNKQMSIHQDWVGIMQLMEANSFPIALQHVVAEIRARPTMHDKFWRYIQLFIEVAAQ